MITEPLLTLLVPNRGNSVYFTKTLENLSSIHDERIEVIILENSYPDKMEFPLNLPDEIFKILPSSENLSMTKNWHRGLTLANGRWTCFVGSDDGVVAGNIPKFLDILGKIQTQVVSTHPIYFQYAIGHKKPWADLPISKLDTWDRKVRYLSFMATVFPQLKLDLPVPYNRCVVRTEILREYAQKRVDIEGVAPDDFLAQFIAQKCKFGTYVEIPVFIHGGSERSNGFQTVNEIESDVSREFMRDAEMKFGRLLQKYGIRCSFALAFEHFAKARISLNQKMPQFLYPLANLWAELCCPLGDHHSKSPVLVLARRYFVPLHGFSFKAFRKIWMAINFRRHLPVSNHKTSQPENMDVINLSELIYRTM